MDWGLPVPKRTGLSCLVPSCIMAAGWLPASARVMVSSLSSGWACFRGPMCGSGAQHTAQETKSGRPPEPQASNWTVGELSHPGLPWTFLILALKVPCLGNPLQSQCNLELLVTLLRAQRALSQQRKGNPKGTLKAQHPHSQSLWSPSHCLLTLSVPWSSWMTGAKRKPFKFSKSLLVHP